MLDSERMAERFAGLPWWPTAAIERVEIVALWVKPGRHFNVHYKVFDHDGQARPISGFLLEPERVDRILRRASRRHSDKLAARGACPHCGTARLGREILVQAFPLDYRLATLPDCLHPKAVRRASGGTIAAQQCEAVAYRPGMRCQIRIEEAGGSCSYGKVAVERRGAGRGYHLHEIAYRALRQRGSFLRVAPPRAYLPALELAVVGGVPGLSYHELLRRGQVTGDATELVARAAYELHRLDVRLTDRVYSVSEEIALVRSWVDLAGALYPDVASDLERWYASLLVDPPADCSARAVLHRDFYDKQVLLDGETTVLLDLDTICAGDAELDVGNFRAHYYLRGLQWERSDRFAPLEAEFVRAYPGLLSEQRMLWYRSVALLRLACGYLLRPRWRHLVPTMIAEAGP
ncbi:MAG: hypothetical protein D6815_04565 [Candidatus Dadabacteria bacterium]|nr:MAG: hypothetical protein D6815_04565 [Candidatus Dadabacteria bacterium]